MFPKFLFRRFRRASDPVLPSPASPQNSPAPGAEAPSISPVYLLEQLKDRILATFARQPEISSIWSGDAKEMYYSMVMVDQLVSRGRKAEDARAVLEYAASRGEQVASELRSLGDAGSLEAELRTTFAACRSYMESRLPPPSRAAEAPPSRILAISDEQVLLPCSVCGKTAVAFQPPGRERVETMPALLSTAKVVVGQGERDAAEIICSGITRSVELRPKDKILNWLAKNDLAALHAYMDEQGFDGGLDAYCPQCDRIFCREHYCVREEYDEGFYDCCRGTCPQGHSRIVDD